MPVQQHVLNWLYSVLTSEYHDVNRTYNDVAQAIAQYPSLSPRTDVHTFPNGVSALLLLLSGTIPAPWRGTTYWIPISIWVPHAYPREPPLVYVTPTDAMVVRPGQHVDPQGQVYHPYLVGWAGFWDKSTILDFIAILRDVFAKEPPVYAKQQARPTATAHQPNSTPPPVPPLPPDMARPASIGQTQSPAPNPRPPPPPPKGNEGPIGRPSPVPTLAGPSTGPPLPPHPPHPPQQQGQPLSELGSASPPGHQNSQSGRFSRYDSAPPLPPQLSGGSPGQHHPAGHPPPAQPPYQQQHVQAHHSYPPPDPRRASLSPAQQYAQPPHAAMGWQQQHQHQQFQHPQHHQSLPPQHPQQQQQQQQQPPPPPQPHQQYHQHRPVPEPRPQTFEAPPHSPPQPQPAPAQKKPPPPDLMDEPLVLSVPPPSNVPAPPIPPNPEKDALLHQLAQTLHVMRQQSRAQNDSTMSGLQAQRTAMLNSLSVMQSEASGLSQLSAMLASNTNILHDALRRADTVIADAHARQQQQTSSDTAGTARPASGASAPGLPDVDELLVAPTVVANQLYDLVAEERALADAVFVLGRAVERGRISPAVFAKTMRSLSREWFLKKALVRKIARGMGLITQ